MNRYTVKYSDVIKFKGFNFRDVIKSLVLRIITIIYRLTDLKDILSKPRIQFLYIHHIFEDEIDNIERLILALSEKHNFISYSEAFQLIKNNKIDKPYIVFSSDDGFKNNLNFAKVLDKFNIKCCFFVNPDSIGLKEYSKIKKYCSEKLNMPPIEFLDWQDILYLKKNDHEIGSHSLGHVNFSMLNKKDISNNLTDSKYILENKCGQINHFAYPYGREEDFNKTSFNEVFKSRYMSCSSAIRGCHFLSTENSDRLLIKRDIVVMNHNFSNIFYFLYRNAYQHSKLFLNPFK